jgi:bifunctional UDP-N-acetylglucosamine pyrophosphorylase/glucosamine-1-phosphate N-acetyltransferase/UDP-N-acetylglucosamine pyrophosphorylase
MKSELPKVLCKANGRPLVAYVVDSLRAAGVQKIITVVGYRADLVETTLRSAYHNIEFALQAEQLGTGHAVMMCRAYLQHHDGPVVVVAGDSPMLQADSIEALLEDFADNHPACLLGTLKHSDPTGLGRIVRDSAGKFVGIVEEKDASDEQRKITEVNMSTYVFHCRHLLSALDKLTDDNQQEEYYITDVPGILLQEGQDVRALAVLKPIEALSVNTLEHLADVERELKDRLTDA